MEKLYLPNDISLFANYVKINVDKVGRNNYSVRVLNCDHSNLLVYKYDMINESFTQGGFAKNLTSENIKYYLCNIIRDFFNLEQGVILAGDSKVEELLKESIDDVKNNNYEIYTKKNIIGVSEVNLIGIYVGHEEETYYETKGMRDKASRISGAIEDESYPYVVVNPCHYNEIEEFALENGYITNEEAKELLEKHRKLYENREII